MTRLMSFFLVSMAVFFFNVVSATLLGSVLKNNYLFTVLGISIFSFSLSASLCFLFSNLLKRLNPKSAFSLLSFATGLSFVLCLIAVHFIEISINARIAEILPQYSFSWFVQGWLDVHQTSAYLLGFAFGLPFFVYGVLVSYLFLHAQKAEFSGLCLTEFLGGAIGTGLAVFLLEKGFLVMIGVPPALCLTAAVFTTEFRSHAHLRRPIRLGLALLLLLIGIVTVGPKLEPRPNLHVLARNYQLKEIVKELWTGWTSYARVSLIETQPREGGASQKIIALGGGESHAAVHEYHPSLPTYVAYPASLALALGKPHRVLTLFAGVGRDLVEIESRYPGEVDLTGVELNSKVWEAGRQVPDANLETFYSLPNVHMHLSDNRSFLEHDKGKYDVILFAFSGVTMAYYVGTIVHTSQYSYTCEAIGRVLEHLSPTGFAVFMDVNKINLISCLREKIKGDISSMVAMVENGKGNWLSFSDDYALYIKPSGISKADARALKRLAGTEVREVLDPFELRDTVLEPHWRLLRASDYREELKQINATYGKRFSVTTDDSPFVFNIDKYPNYTSGQYWVDAMKSVLHGEITKSREVFLIFLAIISAILILIPVTLRFPTRGTSLLGREGIYFGLIGLGHMAFQVAVTHRMALILGNPSYALAFGVGGFLLSYGSGSYFLSRRKTQPIAWRCALLTGVWIALCTSLYFVFTEQMLSLSLGWRMILSLLLLFPAGFLGGQLYPLGLSRLAEDTPLFLPMAVAIDGAAGCIAVILAPLLLEQAGFRWVGFLGASCYLGLAIALRVSSSRSLEVIDTVSDESHLDRSALG